MYPLTYEADYEEQRDRLLTALRPIIGVPWVILVAAYHTAGALIAIFCWLSILVSGRYPQGFYHYAAGLIQCQARVQGWMGLQTDDWPSVAIGEDPAYPIHVEIEPRPERFSRLGALARPVMLIPVLLAGVLLGLLGIVTWLVSWILIIVTGRQPIGLHNALTFVNAYLVRGIGFAYLLTETLPPLSGQEIAAATEYEPPELEEVALDEKPEEAEEPERPAEPVKPEPRREPVEPPRPLADPTPPKAEPPPPLPRREPFLPEPPPAHREPPPPPPRPEPEPEPEKPEPSEKPEPPRWGRWRRDS